MSSNLYLSLTEEFNAGRLRAVICSGQAVVLHRLAIMSKDGDWIIREDEEAIDHILSVLESHGSTYRFGAPLDLRWLRGGWSAHLEFSDQFRVRTDFFTRPPRITPRELARIWQEQEGKSPPFINARDLALMKMTNREKDYVIIGELSRIMDSPSDKLRFSRSARDLILLGKEHPDLAAEMVEERPLLASLDKGEERVAELLDQERRALIRKNEQRLDVRRKACENWLLKWPVLSAKMKKLPLRKAHQLMVEQAEQALPTQVTFNDHE